MLRLIKPHLLLLAIVRTATGGAMTAASMNVFDSHSHSHRWNVGLLVSSSLFSRVDFGISQTYIRMESLTETSNIHQQHNNMNQYQSMITLGHNPEFISLLRNKKPHNQM